MKEAMFKIFDIFTEKADFYTNDGYLWLIFTDEEKWVIRLKDGYLLYNYYFFKDCFKYVSLDVIENKHFITEWVEETIQNGVKHTTATCTVPLSTVEETIQNGVKHTIFDISSNRAFVEDTIQNGVKHTLLPETSISLYVEETIQNGVKHTLGPSHMCHLPVEDTIQNGVKISDLVVKNNITYNKIWKTLKKHLKKLGI